MNQIGSPKIQVLEIKGTLEGTYIKSYVNNSGNKKLINLCPSEEGEDKENKYQYIIINIQNYTFI